MSLGRQRRQVLLFSSCLTGLLLCMIINYPTVDNQAEEYSISELQEALILQERSSFNNTQQIATNQLRNHPITTHQDTPTSTKTIENHSTNIIVVKSELPPANSNASLDIASSPHPPASQPTRSKAYAKLSDLFVARLTKKIQSDFHDRKRDVDFEPGHKVGPHKVRRVLILSTWRSGSTFMGDLLASYPGSFYSFEPTQQLLSGQHYQGGDLDTIIQGLLKDILTCSFRNQTDYVANVKKKPAFMKYNDKVWQACRQNPALCFDPTFLSEACQYLPVNVIKTVRLGMIPIQKLMDDPELDLHLIQLVRDPRGSLNSRYKIDWCQSDDCKDPHTVCQHLHTDLKLSRKFSEMYPKRYLLLRYEDLATNSASMSEAVFRFLGLSVHDYVAKFIEDHSKAQPLNGKRKQSSYTTFRDSSHVTFAWRDTLSYQQTDEIQKACSKPLQMLGYRIFQDQQEYTNKTLTII